MSSSTRIDSPSNPRIKELLRLMRASAKRRGEYILIEGARELQRALDAGVRLQALYYCPALFPAGAPRAKLVAAALALGNDVFEVSKAAFSRVCTREGPDGLLAVGIRPKLTLDAVTLPPNPLVVVVEGAEKPGNLGAVVRTADAVGADLIIVCGQGVDPYNPRVIRNSQGLIFALPVVVCEPVQALDWLRQAGLALAVAVPADGSDYRQAALAGPLALAVGTEAQGLSAFWIDEAELRLTIPMHGAGDSLNLSTAAAVLLYEARRQRDCGIAVDKGGER